MFQRSFALVPLGRTCCGVVSRPIRVQSRNVWDWTRVPDARSMIRDLNREMERMERNIFRNFPLSFSLPRPISIEGDKNAQKSYRMIVDVEGFNPEDIKITLKDKVMKIEGQLVKTFSNGSGKLEQSFSREFPLPENVDPTTLKSYVDNSGALYIEAAIAKELPPKDIPIQIEEGAEAAKAKN